LVKGINGSNDAKNAEEEVKLIDEASELLKILSSIIEKLF